MPKAIQNKLRSRRGESLAEVLVAMLIIALSVLLLAVMVTTAGSINMQTRRRDEQFYKDLSAAETFGDYNGARAAAEKTVLIAGTGTDYDIHVSQKVTLHGSDRLLSYSIVPDSSGG